MDSCLPGTPLPAHLPQPSTVRDLVTHCLDITCVPRRSFFEFLSHFSPNDLERSKLQEFSSAQGQEERYAYCNRPRRTSLEVGQASFLSGSAPGHREGPLFASWETWWGQFVLVSYLQTQPCSSVNKNHLKSSDLPNSSALFGWGVVIFFPCCLGWEKSRPLWRLKSQSIYPRNSAHAFCPSQASSIKKPSTSSASASEKLFPSVEILPLPFLHLSFFFITPVDYYLSQVCSFLPSPKVLCDFPHTTCAIPWNYLLDLIPQIRPRAFSIASSMLVR